MSKTVDNKIVEMRFDNAQFEKGVEHTSSMLDRFKEKLSFGKEQTSFKKLEQTANKISFNPLGNAIDAVSVKFNMLDNLMWNGLSRISNKILDVGENLVKSLSVDNISTGWQKYIDKTASVQTILNSTDLNTGQVDEYLSKLMWYSDQTSYSFNDMTNALGQMLTMGGDIDTLIPMIEGMANAVAFAGKGGEAFSSVLRNIKQSYAGGFLTRLDWGSFDTFGVSSIALKEALIQAGEELGTIKKGEITLENFTETLTEKKWATTKVMEKAFVGFASFTDAVREAIDSGEFESVDDAMEALKADYDEIAVKSFYAGQKAKSFTEAIDATKDAVSTGWMTTLQYVFGDYDEAIVLWTNFCDYLWDIFASSAESRNEVFAQWKDMLGRDTLISAISNIGQIISDFKDTISESFTDIFGTFNAVDFTNLTHKFERFTESIKPSEETLSKLKRILDGLFSIFTIIGEVLSATYRNILIPILKELGIVNDSLLDFGADVGDGITAFAKWVQEVHPFENTFRTLGAFIKNAISVIKDLINWIGKLPIVKDVVDWIKSAFNVEEASQGLPKLQLDFESVCSNIGSFFTGLWTTISGFFSNLISGGKEASSETSSIFSNFSADGIQATFEGITSSIGTFVTNAFDGVKTFVTDIIESVKNNTETGWEGIQSLGATIWEKLTGFFSGVVSGVSDMASNAKTEGDKIGGVIGTIISFIGSLITGIIDWFQNLDLFKVSLMAIIGIVAAVIITFSKFGNLLGNIMGPFEDIASAAQDVAKGVKTFLNAEAFLAVAKGLTMIIGAMVVLAMLPVDQVATAGIVVGGVLIVMVILVKSLSAYSRTLASGGANAAKSAGLLLSMAGALALLAIAFGIVTLIVKNTSSEQLGLAFLELFGLLSSVIIVLYLISQLPMQNLGKSAKAILEVAVAVILLVVSLKMVVDIVQSVDAGALGLSLGVVVILLGAVIGAMALMVKMQSFKIGKASAAILEVAGAVILLTLAMKIIATMPADQLGTGLAVISGFLIGIIGVLFALSKMGTGVAGAGLAILAISAAIILLIADVKLASKLAEDVPAAIAGFVVVGVLLELIVLVLKQLSGKDFGKNIMKAGTTILLISVAIGILTICIGLLATLAKENLEGTLVATGIIELILITMAGILLALSKNKNIGSAVPALITLAVIIGIIAVLLIALAAMQPEHAFEILGGVALVFASLAAVLLALSFVKNGTDSLAPLIALGVIIGEIGGIIYLLATLEDPSVVLPICEGLSLVMGSLAGVLFVISKINIPTDHILKTVGSIILIIDGIAAAIDVAALMFVGLGALVSTFGEDNGAKAMDTAVKLLTSFGEGIGNFVGGIITGIGEAVIKLLMNLITGLVDAVAESIKTLSNLGSDGEKAAEMLVIFSGALLALGAAELITGLSNLIGTIFSGGKNPLISVCKNLVETAPYINEFCEAVADLTLEDALKASLFADVIGSIANAMPTTGGWLDTIFGEKKSLSDFAAELALMGPSLLIFAASVKGLTVEDIEPAVTAAKMIADVQTALPSYGGKLQEWFGSKQTLGEFAKMLIPFGKGMKGFAKAIDGVTFDDVEKAASTAKMIAEMEGILPESGGALQYWTGEKQTLAEFARQLPLLGTKLKEFADNASGLKQDDVDKAVAAADMLSGLEDNLPDHGGIIKDWFTGDATLASFGENLVTFGEKMWEFQGKIGGLNLEEITNFTNILNALVQSAITTSVNNVSGLSNFATELVKFADSGFTEFVKKTTEAIVSSVTANDQAYQDAGALIVEFMTYGLTDSEAKKDLTEALDDIVSIIVGTFKSEENIETQIKMGKTILQYIGNGMLDSAAKKELSAKINNVFDTFVDTTKEYKNKWVEAGKNLATGLKEGIEEGQNSAIEACANLARKMEEEIRKQWDEHSPSKVAAKDGANFTQGLLNGLTQNSEAVTTAGRSLATSVRDAVSYAMSLAQDSDLSPTITPVLDFSQLNQDMKQLNGLNGISTFNMTPQLGNISGKTKQSINVYAKSDNQDVVDSISKLQNGIETLGDKMSKLQVKMDTGALVGEIISPIDKSLGVRAARSLRERSR